MAEQLSHKIISKHHGTITDLESLFLGVSGLLDINTEDKYILKLQNRFQFLKHKYQFKISLLRPQFFRLRPDNFPSLRLAQLAKIYHKQPQLFQHILQLKTKKDFYTFFDIQLSSFWDTHYSLTKNSKSKTKKLSQSFISLLIINTIIPIKFCYEKQQSIQNFDTLLELISSLNPEQNSKVNVFENLRLNTNKSSLESQALLQLKTNYCDKNYCLQCHLGQKLINQSV
jgi:hypothetical protein